MDALAMTQNEIIEAGNLFVIDEDGYTGSRLVVNDPSALRSAVELEQLRQRESKLLALIEECADADPGQCGPLSDLPSNAILREMKARITAAAKDRAKTAREHFEARIGTLRVAMNAAELPPETDDGLQALAFAIWTPRDARGEGGAPGNAETLASAFLAAYYRVTRRDMRRKLRTS